MSFLKHAVQFPAFLCRVSRPQSIRFLLSGRVTVTFLLLLCDWTEVVWSAGLAANSTHLPPFPRGELLPPALSGRGSCLYLQLSFRTRQVCLHCPQRCDTGRALQKQEDCEVLWGDCRHLGDARTQVSGPLRLYFPLLHHF